MKAIELTKESFVEKIGNYESAGGKIHFVGEKPAIVIFYLSWCGHCHHYLPLIEEVAEGYSGKIELYKVDAEKEEALAMAYDIKSVPATLCIKPNGSSEMKVGEIDKDAIKECIEKIL